MKMPRTVLRITSPDLRNSYVVISCVTLHGLHLRNTYVFIMSFMSNIDQKQNWVKLKLVLTLLRIACLADRWSLYVSINVKSWPKVKMYQVEVSSNIAQNGLFSPYKVICGNYHLWSLYVPILLNVDQTRNWVKLKSVQKWLRIACLADIKLYVVIMCANSCKSWPKVKLGQVQVDLNIAQNHFH